MIPALGVKGAAVRDLGDADPATFGSYRTVYCLSDRTGFGDVYLARDPEGVAVAVKAIRQDKLTHESIDRFHREIDFLDRFRHPRVPELLDYELTMPRPWLAVRYVAGLPLSDVVYRCGALPMELVLHVGAELAAVVERLHLFGAHRDIKPGNVLLALDGPQLIDFGLARSPDHESLTRSGFVAGTPGHMAPERVTRRPQEVDDQRSDVYELGGVILHAATGSKPVVVDGRGHPRGFFALADAPPPLPRLLEAVLSPEPHRRPTSRWFAHALATLAPGRTFRDLLPPNVGALLADVPAATRPSEGLKRSTGRPMPTRIATLAVGTPSGRRREGPARRLWRARLGGSVAALAPGPSGSILAVTASGDVHGVAGDGGVLWSVDGSTRPLAVARYGALAAIGSPDAMRLIDPARGGEIVGSLPVRDVIAAAVTAAGLVVVGAGGVVARFEVPGRTPVAQTELSAAHGTLLVVGGNTVHVAGRDGTITALAVDDLKPRWSRTLHRRVLAAGATPDRLLLTTAEGEVVALRGVDGETAWTNSQDAPARAVSLHPRLDLVVVATPTGRLRGWGLDSGGVRFDRQLPSAVRRSLTGGRDGEVLVGTQDGAVYSLDVENADVSLHDHDGSAVDVPVVALAGWSVIGRADGSLTAIASAPATTDRA